MLARIVLVLMDDLAMVDAVLQHRIERATGKLVSTGCTPVPVDPHLADDAIAVKILLEIPDRAERGVSPVDMSDRH